MINVLVVGHGAREHVIGESLINSGAKLFAFMSFRNAGLDELSEGRVKIHSETDFKELIKYCQDNKVDFVIIGPEAPLVVGIVDALEKSGISCVGPKIEVAQLEGSKIFTRELLEKYKISSNVISRHFYSMEGIESYIKDMGEENIVIKPDGLTGGKGVKIYGEHLFSKRDIIDYCQELIQKKSGFLLEEKCEGEEFTLQTFVDGHKVIGSPLVQDHKRAYENDTGPNTGGMGSYSCSNHLMPFIDEKDVNYALEQMTKVVNAVKNETGIDYKGFLYGQFMKTAKGIKLIEFNVRFGDPEAMNVLPLLKNNFLDVCYGIIGGNLSGKIGFEKQATVCKYLAPKGYPESPKKETLIEIDYQKLTEIGAKCYYASVYKKREKIYTTTSRAIAILGVADNLNKAEDVAEQGVNCIKGQLFHRKDVGTSKLLQKRINHMNSLLDKNK
ncbi:MAG: phosphoribosylamine--glycine ligase [Promethearchaeota archaeon]